MPRIEVAPGELHGAGGRQSALAGRMLETCGRLDAAGAAGAGGAGESGAASAIGGFAQSWSAALRGLAGAVTATAGNLDAAANAYAGTDENVIPAAKR